MTPDEALLHLLTGNRRFQGGDTTLWDYDADTLHGLSQRQSPLAAIVACSDSRVSPEIIFDQPLGSIFACRIPGNVATESSQWVVDMAISEFSVPLVMVLGHTGCLAIERVAEGSGWGLAGPLRTEIQEAVWKVGPAAREHQEAVVAANAMYAVNKLLESLNSLRSAVESGRCRIVAAVYDMKTGKVDVLD